MNGNRDASPGGAGCHLQVGERAATPVEHHIARPYRASLARRPGHVSDGQIISLQRAPHEQVGGRTGRLVGVDRFPDGVGVKTEFARHPGRALQRKLTGVQTSRTQARA